MRAEGYGKGYAYAHSDPTGAKKQRHLPEGLSRQKFFP
jgi:replication-associated recombination protein RarA